MECIVCLEVPPKKEIEGSHSLYSLRKRPDQWRKHAKYMDGSAMDIIEQTKGAFTADSSTNKISYHKCCYATTACFEQKSLTQKGCWPIPENARNSWRKVSKFRKIELIGKVPFEVSKSFQHLRVTAKQQMSK